MMGSVLYVRRLAKSPYSEYLSGHTYLDVQHAFTKDFCSLLGLPAESPLFTAVTIGATALPTIIKMSSILKDKSGVGWTQVSQNRGIIGW